MKSLVSVEIGSRMRRSEARVAGVFRGRGRSGALLEEHVCPAEEGHLEDESSNARRSASVVCHSGARAQDRQNKERKCSGVRAGHILSRS